MTKTFAIFDHTLKSSRRIFGRKDGQEKQLRQRGGCQPFHSSPKSIFTVLERQHDPVSQNETPLAEGRKWTDLPESQSYGELSQLLFLQKLPMEAVIFTRRIEPYAHRPLRLCLTTPRTPNREERTRVVSGLLCRFTVCPH